MKSKIRVTHQHIREGQRGECFKCPIALAIKESRPDLRGISVAALMIDAFDRHNLPVSCGMPRVAWQFTRNFDNKRGVEPFTFEIEI